MCRIAKVFAIFADENPFTGTIAWLRAELSRNAMSVPPYFRRKSR